MSAEKIEAFFEREQPYRDGIRRLREIVLKTELQEELKWGAPVYTFNRKNVLGIMAFKHHFGIWFFNGVFLTDPLSVLENAQEGKTKAMRHWKFTRNDDIDVTSVLAYVKEALENQKKGLEVKPERKKPVVLPELLKTALQSDLEIKQEFEGLSPGKQREYSTYIHEAKQEKTKKSRLEKILPMIRAGKGLNDGYRR
ncbi:MAG: YdeI/OmpD-associated family protein [Eudoraea sp.]|nr:YdeI/OmpD-associated family protein [Eudoraea sp.]